MLPSKKQLARIRVVAQKKAVENFSPKDQVHYGVFLLCYGAGLRVSEALDFDLSRGVDNSFIVKSKGHPRVALVPDGVVRELRSLDWKKNQTNRNNFFKYCQRLKKESNLPKEVELTPHTGRRSFATYTAEGGTPLPVLAEMLGHKSFKTTAEYYWKDTYDLNNLPLQSKFREPEQNKPTNLVNKNFGSAEVKNEFSANELKQNQQNKINFPAFDILKKPNKNKDYWKEYNQKRKDYSRNYYLKNKGKFNQKSKEKNNLAIQLTTKQEQKTKDKNWNSLNPQILSNQHCLIGLG